MPSGCVNLSTRTAALQTLPPFEQETAPADGYTLEPGAPAGWQQPASVSQQALAGCQSNAACVATMPPLGRRTKYVSRTNAKEGAEAVHRAQRPARRSRRRMTKPKKRTPSAEKARRAFELGVDLAIPRCQLSPETKYSRCTPVSGSCPPNRSKHLLWGGDPALFGRVRADPAMPSAVSTSAEAPL